MARARTEAAFGRGGGRFIAPGDQARLSSHRSTFTAWRRPIGQEKRPSGNYWTNSRSDLAKPKLSDYGVAAMSRRPLPLQFFDPTPLTRRWRCDKWATCFVDSRSSHAMTILTV